jgi:hypothetical protein
MTPVQHVAVVDLQPTDLLRELVCEHCRNAGVRQQWFSAQQVQHLCAVLLVEFVKEEVDA